MEDEFPALCGTVGIVAWCGSIRLALAIGYLIGDHRRPPRHGTPGHTHGIAGGEKS
jgi:hypothetical protein